MIIVCIALCVSFGLAIRPALRYDADLPISHTGKEAK